MPSKIKLSAVKGTAMTPKAFKQVDPISMWIETFSELLEPIYGDNFSIYEDTVYRTTGSYPSASSTILIKHDDFIIVNDDLWKWPLKEMYTVVTVFVDLFDLKCRIGGVGVIKGQMTHSEYSYGYVHSHVPNVDISDMRSSGYIPFKSYCLGDTPFKDLVESLNMMSSPNWDKWQQLFVDAHTFISHESLVGKAFTSIEKLTRLALSSISEENNSGITTEAANEIAAMFIEQSKYADYHHKQGVMEVNVPEVSTFISGLSDVDSKLIGFIQSSKYIKEKMMQSGVRQLESSAYMGGGTVLQEIENMNTKNIHYCRLKTGGASSPIKYKGEVVTVKFVGDGEIIEELADSMEPAPISLKDVKRVITIISTRLFYEKVKK